MFYEPGDDPSDKSVHGLPHNPFKAIVAPRPIGWISSVDRHGVANLAPYSFFNGVADAPPMVMFVNNGGAPSGQPVKDSVRNIETTGEFVVNVATLPLKDAMNASSAPLAPDVDEFDAAGLEKAPGNVVSVPRVAQSPAALECRFWRRIDLPAARHGANVMIIGQVVGVHIADWALAEGRFDPERLQVISRLGYLDYAAVEGAFPMTRPKA